jgi:hypothetical protein
MHGIDQAKAFFYRALSQSLFNLRGNVDEFLPVLSIEP